MCCSITTIDILLLKFLIFVSKFSEPLAPRIDRWTQDSVLQLQRRAYEAHGKCNWIGLSAAIPVTSTKEILLDLPIGSVPTETEKEMELLFEKMTAENAKTDSPRISRIEISHVENIGFTEGPGSTLTDEVAKRKSVPKIEGRLFKEDTGREDM